MFGNLVHLNLIRLFKSRIRDLSLVFLIVFVFLTFVIFCVTERQVLASSLAEEDPFFIPQMMIVFSLFDIVAFAVLNVLFATCDYYKYRLLINVEGACRSKTRICLSEIASIVVYSFVLALFPIICGALGSIIDFGNLDLFLNNLVSSAIIYLGIANSIFSSVLPVFAFAKMFRKFLPTVVSCLFLLPLIIAIFSYNILMFINVPFFIAQDMFPGFAVFSYTLALLSNNITNARSVVPYIFSGFIQNVIWIVLAIVASNRKNDL